MIRISIALVAAACLFWSVSASAQAPVAVPPEYLSLFESYGSFVPEFDSEDKIKGNSIENWATYALNTMKRPGITAIRNWLFTRGEDRILRLAMNHKEKILAMFARQFNMRGMHVVFAQPYTVEIDATYRAWYGCAAGIRRDGSDESIGEERVLREVNSWVDANFARLTFAGDCKREFQALSAHYGVERLSADDVTAIGFLSRRFAANRLSSKFVSAEFLRKLVHDLFDPDEE